MTAVEYPARCWLGPDLDSEFASEMPFEQSGHGGGIGVALEHLRIPVLRLILIHDGDAGHQSGEHDRSFEIDESIQLSKQLHFATTYSKQPYNCESDKWGDRHSLAGSSWTAAFASRPPLPAYVP